MSDFAQITAKLPTLSAAELAELRGFVDSELRRKRAVAWPDFAARLDRLFPNGPPPGKTLSTIVDEGRGEY